MCETTLWRAVLLQAVRDATKALPSSAYHEEVKAQCGARFWLLTDNGDFPRCCIMADIEPDHVPRLGAQTGGRRLAAREALLQFAPGRLGG